MPLTNEKCLKVRKLFFFVEVIKWFFYLSIPTKSNPILKKKRFMFFVFFVCALVIFGSVRFIQWTMLVWATAIALILFLFNLFLHDSYSFYFNEMFAMFSITSWAVILSNIITSSILFNIDLYSLDNSWAYYFVISVSDWNFGFLISDIFQLDIIS